jgi:hypothetical protein
LDVTVLVSAFVCFLSLLFTQICRPKLWEMIRNATNRDSGRALKPLE